VGLAVGEPVTPPVQATPLRVKLPGTGLLDVQPPLKPKDVLPPVAREPLYETLTAVTAVPLCVTVAFQACVTVCPAPKLQRSVQLLTGSPRLVMATLAPKPPAYWELMV